MRSRLVSAVKFDLALVDLGLPDGSGVDVVAALRESQPDVQSVVVTIHDDDEHLFPALQAGAFGYVLKEQPRELSPSSSSASARASRRCRRRSRAA